MSRKPATPSKSCSESENPSPSYQFVLQQCRLKTPESIIELLARQLDRANEAKRRIMDEGAVVRDLKGSVVPHPAIKIEQDATKIYVDLIGRYRRP